MKVNKTYKFLFTYAEDDSNLEITKTKEIITTNCQNALRLFGEMLRSNPNYMITNISISKNWK